MFERFDPPLIPDPGPDDLTAAKARWATRRRRIVMAASGTSVVVVVLLAALLAPTFGLGNHDQHVASTGPATTTTQLTPPTTEGPTTSTTVHRRPVTSTSTHPPTTTTPPATAVETYSPWTAAGTLSPGVRVRNHLSGTTCSPGSFDEGSQYAWRCSQSDGAFYDPCFAPPGQTNVTTVACTYSPWSPVDLMTLSQPLPNSASGGAKPNLDHPWAMLLTNGEQCGLIEGTGTQIGQTMFNYGCWGGYASYPDRKTEPWTVPHSAGDTGPITSVAVKTAWA